MTDTKYIMTDVDWAKFENYIKAKNISRNYKSELKTLINLQINKPFN